jgi:hypothetical protein
VMRAVAFADRRASPVSDHAHVWVSRSTAVTPCLPKAPVQPHS